MNFSDAGLTIKTTALRILKIGLQNLQVVGVVSIEVEVLAWVNNVAVQKCEVNSHRSSLYRGFIPFEHILECF